MFKYMKYMISIEEDKFVKVIYFEFLERIHHHDYTILS